MVNIDAHNHVKGKSIYLDDIQELQGTLYALPFDATVAHAKIKSIDFEAALKRKGIVDILTAKRHSWRKSNWWYFPRRTIICRWRSSFSRTSNCTDHRNVRTPLQNGS